MPTDEKSTITKKDLKNLKNKLQRDRETRKGIIEANLAKKKELKNTRNAAMSEKPKDTTSKINPKKDQLLIKEVDELIEEINSNKNGEKIDNLLKQAAAPSKSDQEEIDRMMQELQAEVNKTRPQTPVNRPSRSTGQTGNKGVGDTEGTGEKTDYKDTNLLTSIKPRNLFPAEPIPPKKTKEEIEKDEQIKFNQSIITYISKSSEKLDDTLLEIHALNETNPKEASKHLQDILPDLQDILLDKKVEIESQLSDINRLLDVAFTTGDEKKITELLDLDNQLQKIEDFQKSLSQKTSYDPLKIQEALIKKHQESLSKKTNYDPLKIQEELITKIMNPESPPRGLDAFREKKVEPRNR